MSQNKTTAAPGMIRITPGEMEKQFYEILLQQGLQESKAGTCAKVFTENSIDGVYTHGVNRFPRFVQYLKDKHVIADAEPILKSTFGAVQQWDGQAGPGILNALFCTEKAMDLARNNGIGCVALAQTNHWMRGGTYGWKAAKEGFAFICWTNTIANMPAFGAKDIRLGNNPLIIAVPFEGEAIILDMAMSQFSFGKIELMKMQGEPLPVAGGYDTSGAPSTDPAAITESGLLLPAGYWKGAGLSLLLDMLAAILSGGLATTHIGKGAAETNVSQVFIAIDLSKLGNASAISQTLQTIIDDYKSSTPVADNAAIRYPGEGVVKTRRENLEKGIPVNEHVWKEILMLDRSV
ncbi:MAG: 3-dehydro-L-gulonate 2-dehydrogenase [Bacteroidota bacterium]|nr:3-dehydro-L-gulonate 2-dehydrogenase [Bacteroidota bacterium]